jgi:hypothetical protein
LAEAKQQLMRRLCDHQEATDCAVSDHPVTVYNAALPPETAECVYPLDPGIELVGAQTIFPMDANHCLILTNLEYAEDPDRAQLLLRRTNARFRGHSFARTDAFIRGRSLTEEEVHAINAVLKSRARKDGSTAYRDKFGRSSRAHEALSKELPAHELGPGDECGCGSGIPTRREVPSSQVTLQRLPAVAAYIAPDNVEVQSTLLAGSSLDFYLHRDLERVVYLDGRYLTVLSSFV